MAELFEFEDNQYLTLRGVIFDELRNDHKHTDVVIVTSDGTKFACHKIILIAGCPFFRGLFASDMVESRQNEVNLDPIDISGPLFKQVLEFIYTGKIKLNFEDAKAINIYAGLLTMTNLKNITEICLMKNITNETCLELWRHSEKYFNDNLKEFCLSSVSNSEVFLDSHVEKLTMEEIKSIVSLKKLNSKILLQNIVKWIKVDFENRQKYIKDLIELINLDDIKDEDYQRELFSDEIMKKNNDFLNLSTTYLLSLSSIRAKKKLFVVTEDKIFYTDFDKKEFIVTSLCPGLEQFATSCHSSNGFVITGGYNKKDIVNSCSQFCPNISVTKEFPRLIEARACHRNYTVGGKIYTCGGPNKKTVEIFEEEAGKWISGPAMISERLWFGAADDSENSLYAIGGLNMVNNSYALRKSIEHFDTRMNSWQTIFTDPSVAVRFTQSAYKDTQLYCFGEVNGFIFDIRANKKLTTIPYKLDNTRDFRFHYNEFDCTIVENEIWLIGKVIVNNREEILNAFKLDLQTNTWHRKMFRGLDGSETLSLVWCRNN